METNDFLLWSDIMNFVTWLAIAVALIVPVGMYLYGNKDR